MKVNQEERDALIESLLAAARRMDHEDILAMADALHELIRRRRRAVERYAVMQTGGEWRIVGPRRRMGHFADRAQALAAGAQLGREAGAYQPGLPPQVSQPLWTDDEARAEA